MAGLAEDATADYVFRMAAKGGCSGVVIMAAAAGSRRAPQRSFIVGTGYRRAARGLTGAVTVDRGAGAVTVAGGVRCLAIRAALKERDLDVIVNMV